VAHTRTVPCERRITDFIALAIVTCAFMEFCSEILAIRDTVSIVALTLACVSHPILQLLKDRRCEDEPSPARATALTAIIATAPWIVLGWLRAVHPAWAAWQSPAVPVVVRYMGCVLACGIVVTRPLLDRAPVDPDDAELFVPRLTLQSQAVMISVLLVSGSLAAAGLTVYWLAAAGIQRLASEGAAAALRRDVQRVSIA
jgi:hypothetical protein